MTKYPFHPLAAAMRLSESQACKTLNSNYRYVYDGMSLEVAERLALKAGFHPFEVWPVMAHDIACESACVRPERTVTVVGTCPECGRAWTGAGPSLIADDALSGEQLMVCADGHKTLVRVVLEAA